MKKRLGLDNPRLTKGPMPQSKGFQNLIGMKFGHIQVSEYIGKLGAISFWQYTCSCGNVGYDCSSNIKKAKSCGCENVYMSKHGQSRKNDRTPEYVAWSSMRQRCFDTGYVSYKDYGARGVKICNRWNDFSLFVQDMGKRPSGRHSLERLNTNGDYEPSNCRWATMLEQCKNKRNNHFVLWDGEKIHLQEAINRVSIKKGTLHGRLRIGWTMHEALNKPIAGNPEFKPANAQIVDLGNQAYDRLG